MSQSLHPTLYTIGHSDHELMRFIELLNAHGITAIGDVRSSPYSLRHPQFNRETLRDVLQSRGIYYVFLGNELGARRSEPECYSGAKARYDLIARSPLFHAGLERVCSEAASQTLALMCAEKDPLTCHRAILVCRHLRRRPLTIQHVLANGELEEHSRAETRLVELTDLAGQLLFCDFAQLVEEAYDVQSAQIAYVARADASESVEA